MRGISLLFLGVAASFAQAATLQEDFSSNPAAQGWKSFGETNLFRWNPTNENVEVTWDSAKTNSYFYQTLGTVLTKSDDFSLQFDLRMQDIAVGVNPNKLYTFELAVGLLNFGEATRLNFFRGSGVNATHGARSVVEFAYFPEAGSISATLAPTVVSSNNVFAYSHNFPLELTPGDLFQIKMDYTAASQTLKTTVQRNGEPFGMPPDNHMEDIVLTGKPDFRLDAVAVASYNDDRQTLPQYAGSLRAHGIVDNFRLTLPPPPVANFIGGMTNGVGSLSFETRTNWTYTWESSTNLTAWTVAGPGFTGTGQPAFLEVSNPAAENIFFRVRAERP